MPVLKRPLRLPAAPPALLLLLLLAGCAGTTSINELLVNPTEYNGEKVRVEGEVTESAGAFGVGGYQLRDETGTITVVASDGAPPPRGSRVRVEGTFEALATIGSRSVAVIRETRREAP